MAEERTLQIAALRQLSYAVYLRTSWWRTVRNAALRDAGYRCQRCGVRRELEVHHRTYEHLGDEQPGDLEVVCRGCHEGEHYTQTQTGIGVYARVLSDVLGAHGPGDAFADIIEEAKCRCIALKIPYHADRFNAAVNRLVPRFPFTPPTGHEPLYHVSEDHQPLSRAEAASVLAKLNAASLMKHIPQVRVRSLREVECRKALRILAQGVKLQIERCEDAERRDDAELPAPGGDAA